MVLLITLDFNLAHGIKLFYFLVIGSFIFDIFDKVDPYIELLLFKFELINNPTIELEHSHFNIE